MATLTAQPIVRSGLNPTMAAADAGGDKFANVDGRIFLFVENANASTIVVTLDIQKNCQI